jgi:mRNA interferase MazF
MKPSSIILTNVSQADGKSKLRPAVVLCKLPKYNDLLVCGISSQIHQVVDGFDEIINEHDSDFKNSGLAITSLIRLGFLAVLQQKNIAGTIGTISDERHNRLLHHLSDYLLRKITV